MLPAAIALMVTLAFVAQLAYTGLAGETVKADHGGAGTPGVHVKLVPTGNPAQNLADVPLIINNVGDTATIDLLVELPSSADNIYDGEFHFDIQPRGIVRVLDAWPETPGVQLDTSGENPRLALTGRERLRFTIDGFPDNGNDVRSCVGDPDGSPGDDSIYTFIKGATGDTSTDIQLQLLNQHWKAEWGNGWCGPTAAGTSLAWFAEVFSGDYGNLVPRFAGMEDNFDSENGGAGAANYSGFANWVVTGGGTVDLIGNGTNDCRPSAIMGHVRGVENPRV